MDLSKFHKPLSYYMYYIIYIYILYLYIYNQSISLDATLKQEWIFGKKTTETNVNTISITHMPRSFTDQIWRTLKYMQKLKDTYSSHLMPL